MPTGGHGRAAGRGGARYRDWYAPFDRAGAAVAFQGKHPLVQASFGFYASILDNPEPFRQVKAVEFVSDNTGVPILLAAAGVRFRDWAEGDRRRPAGIIGTTTSKRVSASGRRRITALS